MDNHNSNSVESTACSAYRELVYAVMLTEFDVVSVKVMDCSLGEHGVVLELSSSDGWAVVGDHDKLGFTLSEGLDGRFISFTHSLAFELVSKNINDAHLPSLYFPDLMTRASFWFMFSCSFFWATALILHNL